MNRTIPIYHRVSYANGCTGDPKTKTLEYQSGQGILLQPLVFEKPSDSIKSIVVTLTTDDGQPQLLLFDVYTAETSISDLGRITREEALTHNSPILRERALRGEI